MRFKPQRKVHVSLDSIALTDIITNLLIFFLITFSLVSTFSAKRESPMKVDLPGVSKGPGMKSFAAYEIVLTKAGTILWNGAETSLAKLKKTLQDEYIRKERVSLRADRGATVQALVQLLEAVRDSGATNVSLQTQIQRQS